MMVLGEIPKAAFRFKCETLSFINKNKGGQSEGLKMGYVKSSKILNVENFKRRKFEILFFDVSNFRRFNAYPIRCTDVS